MNHQRPTEVQASHRRDLIGGSTSCVFTEGTPHFDRGVCQRKEEYREKPKEAQRGAERPRPQPPQPSRGNLCGKNKGLATTERRKTQPQPQERQPKEKGMAAPEGRGANAATLRKVTTKANATPKGSRTRPPSSPLSLLSNPHQPTPCWCTGVKLTCLTTVRR